MLVISLENEVGVARLLAFANTLFCIFILWSICSHRFVQLPESDPVPVVDPGEEVVEEGALARPQHAPKWRPPSREAAHHLRVNAL